MKTLQYVYDIFLLIADVKKNIFMEVHKFFMTFIYDLLILILFLVEIENTAIRLFFNITNKTIPSFCLSPMGDFLDTPSLNVVLFT